MTITATQTQSEFARNTLRIFFYRGTGRFLLVLAAAMLGIYAIQWVMVLFGWSAPTLYLAVAGIGFLTLLPALVYRKASMTYASNPAINQPVTYTFSKETVKVDGVDMQAEIPWSKVFLVAEIKEMFAIYYTPQIANPIPIRNFSDEEYQQFLKLVESIPGLSTAVG